MTEEVFHPDYVSPIYNTFYKSNLITIYDVSLTQIITSLEKTLSEIPHITHQYSRHLNDRPPFMSQQSDAIMRGVNPDPPKKEFAYFTVESGTYPDKVIERRWCKPNGISTFDVTRLCYDVRETAMKWFPHNKPDPIPFYYFGDEIPYLKWCNFHIHIRFNQPIAPKAIILDFSLPISADCCWESHRIIYQFVSNRLRQEFNWAERKHYLKLAEGCPATIFPDSPTKQMLAPTSVSMDTSHLSSIPTAKQERYRASSRESVGIAHISRFLFNETIIREVNSYLHPRMHST